MQFIFSDVQVRGSNDSAAIKKKKRIMEQNVDLYLPWKIRSRTKTNAHFYSIRTEDAITGFKESHWWVSTQSNQLNTGSIYSDLLGEEKKF